MRHGSGIGKQIAELDGTMDEQRALDMADPKFREAVYEHGKRLMNVKAFDRQEENQVVHGIKDGRAFKYDLPVLNEPIVMLN